MLEEIPYGLAIYLMIAFETSLAEALGLMIFKMLSDLLISLNSAMVVLLQFLQIYFCLLITKILNPRILYGALWFTVLNQFLVDDFTI